MAEISNTRRSLWLVRSTGGCAVLRLCSLHVMQLSVMGLERLAHICHGQHGHFSIEHMTY